MQTQLAINEVEYLTGKNEGKMLSAFFPIDCNKKCIFCTTKQYYNTINENLFREQLINIASSNVEEVIFTGGEPLSDIKLLKQYLDIVHNKIVYINTCLDLDDSIIDEVINLINSYKCIKGVNISRHALNNKGINIIRKLHCNVRINIVGYKIEDISKYVKLWSNIKDNLELSFREDYRNINLNNLHQFDTPTLFYLTKNYTFYSQIYCHVCNKYIFVTPTGLVIRYHRGLPNTRLKIGNILEIQELVLFPSGKLCTDWDYTDDGIEEIKRYLNIKTND